MADSFCGCHCSCPWNVFRDLRRIRRALDVVGAASGLRLNPRKSVVINYTRRPHIVVQDIACDGNGFRVGGAGKHLGFLLGPEASAERWAPVRAKFVFARLACEVVGPPLVRDPWCTLRTR